MAAKKTRLGHIAAILTVMIWGTTFVSTKVLLRQFTPIEILFDRFLLGYLALWVVMPKRLARRTWREEGLFAFAGFTGVTLYFLLENIALTYTNAANVGVIVATAPMFTALFAFFFSREEPLSRNFFIGFLVAIAGVLLVSYTGTTELRLNPKGDILALGAALMWGGYSILTKKIGQFQLPVIQTTRRIFFYGLVFMLPFLKGMHYQVGFKRLLVPINSLNLLFLGFIASALCFAIWNFAIDQLGAVKSSAYIYAVPVVTILFSVLFLHEFFTWKSGVGAALIILGLVVSEWNTRAFKKHS